MKVCQVWLLSTKDANCELPATHRITMTVVRGVPGYIYACEYHASIYRMLDHEVVELEPKQEEQVEQDYPGL